MICISFSNEVKNEIKSSVNDKDKRFACLYGMLLYSKVLTEERICFQTESRTSAEIFQNLFKSVFHREISFTEQQRKSDVFLYRFDIEERSFINEIIETYRINTAERTINSEIIAINSLGVFAAGIFIACGSVNDPAKEYHLEFTVPEKKLADELAALLGEIGVNAKASLRRGQYIVYIKGSESIEDTLTFIGAQQCTLELMNVKIYKDVRNKANRIANCDAANIDKTVKAALKQLKDIKLIDRTIGLENLPDELRELAEIRLENTDMSLKDICESLSVPLSRSGVNHRFKKLGAIADEIRAGGFKNESE